MHGKSEVWRGVEIVSEKIRAAAKKILKKKFELQVAVST